MTIVARDLLDPHAITLCLCEGLRPKRALPDMARSAHRQQRVAVMLVRSASHQVALAAPGALSTALQQAPRTMRRLSKHHSCTLFGLGPRGIALWVPKVDPLHIQETGARPLVASQETCKRPPGVVGGGQSWSHAVGIGQTHALVQLLDFPGIAHVLVRQSLEEPVEPQLAGLGPARWWALSFLTNWRQRANLSRLRVLCGSPWISWSHNP